MRYSIKILPRAEQDIDNAYEWYELQKANLGKLFLNELVLNYEKLAVNPFIFSQIERNYRQAIMHRFPYVIIYKIEPTQVIIFSVFHTKQNPRKKFESEPDQ